MNAPPTGIGFYARTLSVPTHGTPAQMAKRLKDCGASWVAFLGCWQDKSGPGRTFKQRVPKLDETARYVEACKGAGIDCWVWGFPWIGHERDYMEAMRRVAAKVGARGLLHDPEVSYRDSSKPPPKGSAGQGEAVDASGLAVQATYAARQAQALIELDRELVADLRLAPSGITSYGMADFHALPWRQLAEGGAWGSPQLYTVGPDLVDRGLASWRKRGFATIIPSVPTYGENSGAKLDAHLARFVDGGGEPTIDGFVIWSIPQTSGVEWPILKRWGEMLRAKSCVAT